MVDFDNEKFDQIVRRQLNHKPFLKAPFLKIVVRTEGDSGPQFTEVNQHFPESLALAIWPAVQIGDGVHGRAIVWDFDGKEFGTSELMAWILRSVRAGRYCDLSTMKYNAKRRITHLKHVAVDMQLEQAIRMASSALDRIEAGEQADASKSVEK